MKQRNFIVLVILVLLDISSCKSQSESKEYKHNKEHLFSQYLSTFKLQTLPLLLDRKGVFELKNISDSLPDIKDSLTMFIPKKLFNDHPNSIFKSLFLLPTKKDITIVLLLQDLVDKFGARIVKILLVTYDRNGKILDFQELAGVNIDVWESFMNITQEYMIEQKNYQFKINNDKELAKLFHLIETTSIYKVRDDGVVEKVEEQKKEGFFKGSWNCYTLVRLIE